MGGRYVAGNRLRERFLESVTPPPVNAIDRVLLYDFETGHSDLRSEHIQGLQNHVVPYLRPDAPPRSVWIGGLASRRGDAGSNRSLARERALKVAAHLLTARRSLLDFGSRHCLVTEWFGERLSIHHTENSEYYRSVLLVISRAPRPQPTPRPAAPERPQAFNRFRIRSHGLNFDGGEGVALGSYGFEVDYDPACTGAPDSAPMVYRLRGYVGYGFGAPFGASVADPDGPWNPFQGPFVTTRGLAGRAAIGGLSTQLGPFTFDSETTLTLLPDASGNTEIDISPYESSSLGVAAALGLVVGPFELIGPP